eukprot:1791431-Rhodomonas_salina.2
MSDAESAGQFLHDGLNNSSESSPCLQRGADSGGLCVRGERQRLPQARAAPVDCLVYPGSAVRAIGPILTSAIQRKSHWSNRMHSL